MAEPHFFDTPSDRAALDISRLPTVRLIPPDVADGLARQRAEAALSHEIEATRLRQFADAEMTRFERSSQFAVTRLDEWLALDHLALRTHDEQARYDQLAGQLERLETSLMRDWAAIAGTLRRASHHEASAMILRGGRTHA
jgi:hypothetical protein